MVDIGLLLECLRDAIEDYRFRKENKKELDEFWISEKTELSAYL